MQVRVPRTPSEPGPSHPRQQVSRVPDSASHCRCQDSPWLGWGPDWESCLAFLAALMGGGQLSQPALSRSTGAVKMPQARSLLSRNGRLGERLLGQSRIPAASSISSHIHPAPEPFCTPRQHNPVKYQSDPARPSWKCQGSHHRSQNKVLLFGRVWNEGLWCPGRASGSF